VIVVETRRADLFEGGLRGDATPESDAADIAGALKEQNASRLDVLSWSNGARVAIDLAASQPAFVRSLVLVAPALSGVEGIPPMPSQFEEELTTIFAAVRKNPVAGSFFSKALRDSIRQRDWDKSSAPGQRARTLLGLPAAGQAPMLIAPLANAALLGHFMGRYAADLVYPMSERIASLKLPMLVVAGEHDTIVNNSYNEAVLACFAPHAVRVAINGAGHCIQDLEYRYLRLLLEEFLADARAPRPAARVHV
jgi:pimeloyl-ACP methyl ester carboxylesterase